MGQELQLLEENKNLILTGAPGTGKTFLAREIALKLIFCKADEKRLSEEEQSAFKNQYCFVQFHPSYDYTDFVEGLRPVNTGGNTQIGFELKDGIFKRFCKKAVADPNHKFVFIIDEINRGEISKIFGELFYSIDPDYRGEQGRVKTQYSNLIREGDVFKNGFYVPKNVYIIGTMNDLDCSVESFDFAMRRRFTFVEITAEQSAENMGLSEQSKNKINALNNVISKTEGLGNSYKIGGAYFLKKDENGKVIDPVFDELWENKLKFLLGEYLRGMSDAKDILKKFKKAYDDGANGDTDN